MVNVEYFIVFIAALAIAAYFIYFIANKIFNINLRIKPLFFCACCSLFLGILLPRLVISSMGITGAMAALISCAILFACFMVYHSNFEKIAMNAIELAPAITEPEQRIEPDITAFESLDDLLDYAFIQKDALQLTTALKAFQRALTLCNDRALAPLIIVEIGNIFKACGHYDEAVQLFSEGRKLPYLLENRILNQQFIEMIAFLRIIKNNLLENQVGLVPYDQIPPNLMLKINGEFRNWLRQKCAKPQTGRMIEE